MEHPLVPLEKDLEPVPTHSAEALLAQKRHVRTLKRILIAKAEMRRLKSLVGRRRSPAR